MPNYRYKQTAINFERLKTQVPGPLAVGGTGAPIFVDINAPAASKPDLDTYMLGIGWNFVGTDIASSPILDARSYPRAILNVAAGGVVVLTPIQAEKQFIVLNGVLAANVTLEFPSVDGAYWTVKNNATLGAFTVSMKVTAQPAPAIALGAGTMSVWSDGLNLQKSTGLIP
jgi:hypothetical protein